MHRLPFCAGLALILLAPRGERIAAVYRQDTTLAYAQEDSLMLEVDEASVTVNGMELPPEALEEMGMEGLLAMRQETSLRQVDVVLAADEGRPTRVRRTFEHLREHSLENGEEQDKTGPLEGRTLVLALEEGEVVAELEGDGEEVEELFLEGHRLTRDEDLLLPEGEVAVGATWQVEDAALREFFGMDSGPALFEPDEGEGEDEDPFDKFFEEGSTVTASVEFAKIEEREGLRCAVLAVTIEFRSELDDPTAFGFELEDGMEEATGGLELEMQAEGKLWFALDEGRPVAIELTLEGTLDVRIEVQMKMEGLDFQMKIDLSGTMEGELTGTWSSPE